MEERHGKVFFNFELSGTRQIQACGRKYRFPVIPPTAPDLKLRQGVILVAGVFSL